MREMTVSIRNDIKVTRRESMNTKKEVQQMILTLNSQPELITQDTTQPSTRVEELNYLIEEINVEKNPNLRNAPTPSNENQNQENQEVSK